MIDAFFQNILDLISSAAFLVSCQCRLYRELERTARALEVMRRVDVSRQRGAPPEGFSTKTTFSGVDQSHKVVFPVDVILQLGVSVEALPAVFTFEEVRGPEVFEKRAPALEHF